MKEDENMENQISEIYKYLSSTDAKSAKSIYDGLNILKESFDDGLKFVNKKISELTEKYEYEALDEVLSIGKNIKRLQVNLENNFINNNYISEFDLEKISIIYKYLNNINKESAETIYYGMELFINSFDDGYEFLKKKACDLINNNEYNSVIEVINFCKNIKLINEHFNNFINKELQKSDSDSLNKSNINIKHKLDEDFEYTKPAGISYKGNICSVLHWKDVLRTACNMITKENGKSFMSIVDDININDPRKKYFKKNLSIQEDKENYKEIYNTNPTIYVRTNAIGANEVTRVIKKILDKLNIDSNTFYIQLRNDNRMNKNTENKTNNLVSKQETHSEIDFNKFGKFANHILSIMKELSDKNYVFRPEILSRLLKRENSKYIFGISFPFFKQVDRNEDLEKQRRNMLGGIIYWEPIFKFNGKEFFICSQWNSSNVNDFNIWISHLSDIKKYIPNIYIYS